MKENYSCETLFFNCVQSKTVQNLTFNKLHPFPAQISYFSIYCNFLYVALPVNFIMDFLLTIDKEAALDSNYRLMDLHFLFHFFLSCLSFPQFHVSIGSSTSPNLIFKQSDALKCSFVFLLHSGVVEVAVDMGYVVHKMKMVREDVLFPQQLGKFCRSYRFRIAKIQNLGQNNVIKCTGTSLEYRYVCSLSTTLVTSLSRGRVTCMCIHLGIYDFDSLRNRFKISRSHNVAF